MDRELSRFLNSRSILCEEVFEWGNGTMPLRVTCYVLNEEPPRRLVSSVRAIVFNDDHVLVVSQKDGGMYILPGGRVEGDELPMETLRREILEETGWTMRRVDLLGCEHFHHLGPKPEGYAYPYPDFLWPIYRAEAGDFTSAAMKPDDWVSESHFRSVEQVKRLPLAKGELLFLEAALDQRRYKDSR